MSPEWKVWIVDTVERVATTVIEVAIVYCLAAQAIDGAFWRGLIVAVVSGALNVIKAAMTAKIPKPRNWALDMMVRGLWTFVIAMFGSLITASWFDLINLEYWKMIALAGGTTALSMLKSVVARSRANTVTPASLAKVSDMPG